MISLSIDMRHVTCSEKFLCLLADFRNSVLSTIVFSTRLVMAAKKWFSLEEVLDELAAAEDSDDDFDGDWAEDEINVPIALSAYGDWCDSDGNLNLHGDTVGCVGDIQALLTGVGTSDENSACSRHDVVVFSPQLLVLVI